MNQHANNQKRWRSPQWKIVSAVLAMIAGISLVWAILAQFELWQRERALNNAHAEITDLRERIEGLEREAAEPAPLEELEEDAVLPPALNDDFDLESILEEFEDLEEFLTE